MRHGEARHGAAGPGMARQRKIFSTTRTQHTGMVRRGLAMRGVARPGQSRRGKARFLCGMTCNKTEYTKCQQVAVASARPRGCVASRKE